ncbi:MAG: metallophosphoesterase, partial [Polyangiaceae bacterium]|nr:metallophosphoesterase [Polyangiaceae bacterium]
MKIWAISDLHLAYDANKAAFETLERHPNDWLILGGDLGETIEHMEI